MKRNHLAHVLVIPFLVAALCACWQEKYEVKKQALTQQEAYYRENKQVCDSLDNITNSFFVEGGHGTEAEQDMARLFHAAHLGQ